MKKLYITGLHMIFKNSYHDVHILPFKRFFQGLIRNTSVFFSDACMQV